MAARPVGFPIDQRESIGGNCRQNPLDGRAPARQDEGPNRWLFVSSDGGGTRSPPGPARSCRPLLPGSSATHWSRRAPTATGFFGPVPGVPNARRCSCAPSQLRRREDLYQRAGHFGRACGLFGLPSSRTKASESSGNAAAMPSSPSRASTAGFPLCQYSETPNDHIFNEQQGRKGEDLCWCSEQRRRTKNRQA